MKPYCKRNSRRQGAILFDTLIAIGILGMGAYAMFSFMPMIGHSQAFATQQSKATQMSAKMVENLQMLRASDLNASVLTQLNLIDKGQANSPFTFSKIPLDDGARYSPSTALPKGTGVLSMTPLADGAVKVKVVISWVSPFGQRSYINGTIVGGYR